MKTKNLFIIAAALAFAACSSDDSIIDEKQVQQPAGDVPVAFTAYVNRGTTRAGATGAIPDATTLQGITDGFGVFGYYTNADNYDQTFTPNFFYNQKVAYSSSAWSYTPVKYWPNEFGSGALSDDVDKVSFFAYAPYVEVAPKTGKVQDSDKNTWGIVGMKNNNTAGDPMVKYISTFYTDKQVDLLWGTVNSATWAKKNTGNQDLTVGMPWLDVQHPSATSTTWADAQKVTFDFKHGLASLNVQVDTKADDTTPKDAAANTKVFIRSVAFEGFDTKGALNLNNAVAGTALWYNFNCEDELNNGAEIVIKDGRKDGKEGLTPATKEYAAINPTFVQSKVWDDAAIADGVTGTAGNLFCKDGGTAADNATDPIFVIPNGDPLKVTIEYDVLTADANLSGKLNDGVTAGSVVKNVITRYITTGGAGSTTTGNITLANGKKYTISLHLGLNSVQFDAAVTDWNATAVTGGADLPHNNDAVTP